MFPEGFCLFGTVSAAARHAQVAHELRKVHPKLGGVNHCSLHCRLASIRGLMYRGNYGAVIG